MPSALITQSMMGSVVTKKHEQGLSHRHEKPAFISVRNISDDDKIRLEKEL